MSQLPQGYGPQQPHQPVPTASPKSPGVAGILSAVIPGLGHLYTGNPIPALLWFGANVVAWLLTLVLIGWVMLPFVWIGAIIHAYISAGNFNRRHHAIR